MDQTTLALSVITGVLCLFWAGVRLARFVRSNARSAGEAAAITGGVRGAATLAALFITTAAPAFIALWVAAAVYVLAAWKVPAPGAPLPDPSAFVPLAALAAAGAAQGARVCWLVVDGPVRRVRLIENAGDDREANMWKYTQAALELLHDAILHQP